MLNFEFRNRTEIYFGKDMEKKVGELSHKLGKKILLHYGGGSIKQSGLYDRIVESLTETGVEFVALGGVQANPRVTLVREGIELCRKEQIDGILAVGGGSVIDSAKGIAAGRFYEGDVWDLYMGKAELADVMPVGVVLTLPAAGSESSVGSVVTNDDGWLKRDIISTDLQPVFAILNPELTYTLPPYQTACGAADMLAHVMERYFTKTRHVELTDRLGEALMKTVIRNASRALENPEDYNARAELMWAGTLAHNNLMGVGREQDWASHIMEHEISGIYDIAHGAGLTIVFPAWMTYVLQEDVARFAQFANRVFDVEYNPYDLEETARKGIESLKAFYQQIGMPISLTEAGIDDTRIDEMAAKATSNDALTIGSMKKLTSADVASILRLAL
ncbi:MAG: iron-containing alcohol dehydrogenase [Bacillota bacterium]|nr:iron-containing alcohol dehydrogenase [Bacillota bacterium]MDW7678663.1 iron-containing alcohol dehydrogenase [Bacillota bacterium]